MSGSSQRRSRNVPDHQPGFEAWVGEPFAHGTTHFELTLQLAVIDARTMLCVTPCTRGELTRRVAQR
jgi:hypothetical protein